MMVDFKTTFAPTLPTEHTRPFGLYYILKHVSLCFCCFVWLNNVFLVTCLIYW
jgi:hypothetical protein